jgi:general secretion pathway protein G
MARHFGFRLRYLGLAALIALPLAAGAQILWATIGISAYANNVKHAREAVLREDLHTIRGAIDQYTYEKHKAPQSVDDLVQAGYLRQMPKDPFTHRSDTWVPDEGSTLDNVHSGAQDVSTEGTTYNTW